MPANPIILIQAAFLVIIILLVVLLVKYGPQLVNWVLCRLYDLFISRKNP
jgi:hypothetical protein